MTNESGPANGLKMGAVTIDCAEPRRLVEFWGKVLGTEVVVDYDGFYVVLAPPPGGVSVAFQKVEEPKQGKNRVHLDFATEDRVGEVARVVGLGASVVREHTMGTFTWVVLTDPDGNEFCIGDAEF